MEPPSGQNPLQQKIAVLEARLRQTEGKLRELEAEQIELSVFLDNTPLSVMVIDSNRQVKKISMTLSRMTGRDPEEHLGQFSGKVLNCVHHLDNPDGCGAGEACRTCKIRETIEKTLETGKPYSRVDAVLTILNSPSPERHLLVSTAILGEGDVLVFFENITEMKAVENALREQNDFFNSLVERISNPIFYKDADGRYIGCNRAFERFVGRPRSRIIGKTVYDMGSGQIAAKYAQKDAELFEKGGEQRYEWKLERSDGEIREVIFDKATLHDQSGDITGIVGVISDITERKIAEDLVRHLSQLLMQAQERERQMIAFELHDCIAQNLSTLKLYCNRLFENHRFPASDKKGIFEDVTGIIDRTIADVRDLAYNLRPANLDHMGLVHALKTYCEEFSEKNRIRLDFQAAGVHESKLNSDIRINIYRLVMEGLKNIQKHADASQASIRLVGAYPNIILRIKDNGRGFDVKLRERAVINEKRMGLRSMKERVNLLNGRMSITSQLNRGTQIVITLPLKDTDNGTETPHINH